MSEVQKLYKYVSLATKEHRARICRLIVRGEIFYAHPNLLNDPVDSEFAVTFDEASRTKNLRAKKHELVRFVKAWFKDEEKNSLCVLSLSEKNDNALMWSHYGDCHKGICLELTVPLDNGLHQVQYSKERPLVYFNDFDEATRDPDRFNRSIIRALMTKSDDWAYEAEWRCIEIGGSGIRQLAG